jgi:hypothetical protein
VRCVLALVVADALQKAAVELTYARDIIGIRKSNVRKMPIYVA